MADTVIVVTEQPEVIIVNGDGVATTSPFTGPGDSGLVPDPGAGDPSRVLNAGGTWQLQAAFAFDAAAVHVDGADEILGVTEKTAVVDADLLLIEDSEAAGVKKRIQVGNLPVTDLVDDVSPQLGADLDTNGFQIDGRTIATDGSKLDTIESGSTGDQTAGEIKTAYESNANTNAFTDAEQTNLGNQSGTNTGDEPDASAIVKGIVELATLSEVNTGTDDTRAVTPLGLKGSALQTKVDGIESGATSDQTAGEIKTAYESNANTNAFTDAEKTNLSNQSGTNTGNEPNASTSVKGVVELATTVEVDTGSDNTRAITPMGLANSALKTKLDGIEAGATADQTAGEIKTAYESNANTNAFTDAEQTKLTGIATGANAYVHPNHTGDVTSVADGAQTIAARAVTFAKTQAVATARLLGRNTVGSGDIEELTATLAKAILAIAIGDVSLNAETNFNTNTVGFTEKANTVSAGATTIDWRTSNLQKLTLDQHLTALTLTSPTNPCKLLLKVVQNVTAGWGITWPAIVHWPGGATAALTSTPSSIDIIALYWDGTVYHGALAITDSKAAP